jgi:hypothetical protein
MWEGKIRTLYNEREWRYVQHNVFAKGYSHINKEAFLNDLTDSRNRDLYNEYKVDFVPNDIKYIIVAEENDRDEMHELLPTIFNDRSPKEITQLICKVMTLKQIKEDF